MTTDCITYHINDDDKIVHVSGAWQSFATENMAGILTVENVLNKSIFDFIADSNTKHLYHMLLERVRTASVSVQFPFRCDSPDRRRYMSMEIFPLQDSLIALKSCTVREELREAVLLLDPDNELLNLVGENKLPNLSHGMCNGCYERIKLELNLAKKSVN